MHRLLKIWYPITMEVALELLDYHYADEEVRALAVKRIEKISNSELKNFLLQVRPWCTVCWTWIIKHNILQYLCYILYYNNL